MEARMSNSSGKVYDPVFLCMVGAIILAVVTSITLRAVVSGAGPAAARAESAQPPSAPSQPVQPAKPIVNAEAR
jgi:hypothetical protein